MTTELLAELILPAVALALIPLVGWPFMERLKIRRATDSLRLARASCQDSLPAVQTAVGALPKADLPHLARMLDQFQASFQQLAIEVDESSPYYDFSQELESLKAQFTGASAPAERLNLAVAAMPVIRNHASGIGLDSVADGFAALKEAADNLSDQLLACKSPAIQQIARDVLLR